MFLGIAARAQLVKAHAVGRAIGRIVGAPVMPERLALYVLKSHAAQMMQRVGEIALDEIGIQPDRLEQLRALIRAERGHAHLGGDVQYAGRERIQVAARGFVGRFVNQTARGHIAHGGLGHIGRNRARAERHEHGRLMRVAHIAAFHGDRDGGALFRAHEVLLQRGDGQQRGQRGVAFVKPAVAQHDDAHALRAQPVAFVEQPL